MLCVLGLTRLTGADGKGGKLSENGVPGAASPCSLAAKGVVGTRMPGFNPSATRGDSGAGNSLKNATRGDSAAGTPDMPKTAGSPGVIGA